ncbi:MAG TPA: hydantoinase/oxoprolinase family protein, partial [Dehalococcoidia bacterium]|nr:hydantoinase/oxoprolinase family protein [Dehalococcoidia bacterium]
TDANLVLGRLPAAFVAGGLRLDVDLAREAIVRRIAEPLGISVAAAAQGIIEVVNHQMAGAIRNVSVERGHDPADFALLPFGGAGALHGAALADLLGIPTVIVPPNPGVLSTFGLLATNLQSDFVMTCLQRGPGYDLRRLNDVMATLRQRATDWLDREQMPAADREFGRAADLRYPAQGFELTVEIPGAGPLTEADLSALEAAFHDRHRQLYTHSFPGTPVELVNLRARAIGRIQAIEPRPWPRQGRPLDAARQGERPVSFAGEQYLPTPVYAWDELSVGLTIPGPAIVEGADATVLVPPGGRAEVDPIGCLVLRGA